MKPWDFLKRQFVREDDHEKPFTHLIDLAVSRLQGGDFAAAREPLLRALDYKTQVKEPPFLEWILNWLSIAWEATEDYEEWAAFFSEFILRNPEHALAYHLRAEAYWYGGDLHNAIADYSKALELNRHDVSAFLGRGQVLMECRDFGQALEDLKRALAGVETVEGASVAWRAQFEAFARNGLAATYAGLEQFGRALEEFDRSIALWPENAWVHYNRAKAYQDHGDQKNAAKNYALALKKEQPKLTATKRADAEAALRALKT